MNINKLSYTFPLKNNSNCNYSNRLQQMKSDVVSFSGASPKQYPSTLAYMASEILKTNQKSNINTKPSEILASIFNITGKYGIKNEQFYTHQQAKKEKNTFPSFYNDNLKNDIINTTNEARNEVFNQWESVINGLKSKKSSHLVVEKFQDPIVRYVVWNAINFDVSENNRHIPPPLNLDVLDKTITYFQNNVKPSERGEKAQSVKYFIKTYNSMLIDNLLDDIIHKPEYSNYKLYDKNGNTIDCKQIDSADKLNEVWVRIPSLKRAAQKSENTIKSVEILSHENWCTRTRANKAKSALEDGNLYIFLDRNNNSDGYKLRTPQLAMTSYAGSIDRIQGALNNGVVPEEYYKTLVDFLEARNFIRKTDSGELKNRLLVSAYDDEGPKAFPQLLIVEYKKALESYIKAKDSEQIFLNLFSDKDIRSDKDGLIMKSYDSMVTVAKNCFVPVTMMGFDEDALLSNLSVVEDTLDLRNATISKFPTSLKSVNKMIVCSKNQFEKFKDDIIKVTTNEKGIEPRVCFDKDEVYIHKVKI
ncbi:hypothetical protein IJ182_09720 [bacterium]|nr:hypothetical protein [bacterium]